MNRLGIFARRAAPIQITWLGQSGPMGIPEIDYMLSDKFICKSQEQVHYSEKIYHMPNFFAPFNPQVYDCIPNEQSAFEKNGYINFACFNNFIKVNDAVLKTWQEILLRTENTKLTLMSHALYDSKICENIKNSFLDRGISGSRLALQAALPKKKYLEMFNEVDIFLDSFPIGGGTTALETLLMSKPLISLFGDKMPHRIASGVLKYSGFEELVTYSREEYIEKAIKLSQDRTQLKNYHTNIRKQFLRSSICDSKLFASDLEAAFFDMWNIKLLNETQSVK